MFLDRAATKPDLIMSDKTDDVRVSVGLCSTSTVTNDYDSTKMLMFDLSEMSKDNQDPTVYELSCSKRLRKDMNSGYNIITLHGAVSLFEGDDYDDRYDYDDIDADDDYDVQLFDPTIEATEPDDASDGGSDAGSGPGAGSSSGSSASGKGSSSTAAVTPKTADPLNALPGVFAVAAAAGAAMAAYSKRRVENERAKAESEES